MKSFLIDKDTGGFVLSAGSPSFIEGKEAKAQQARIRLQTIQGEYFLDPNLGIPYFSDILIKNPSIQFIEFIFADALENLGLNNIQIHGSYEKDIRKFTLAWEATDPDSGDQVSGAV